MGIHSSSLLHYLCCTHCSHWRRRPPTSPALLLQCRHWGGGPWDHLSSQGSYTGYQVPYHCVCLWRPAISGVRLCSEEKEYRLQRLSVLHCMCVCVVRKRNSYCYCSVFFHCVCEIKCIVLFSFLLACLLFSFSLCSLVGEERIPWHHSLCHAVDSYWVLCGLH